MKSEGRRTFLKTSSVGLAGLGSLLTTTVPSASAKAPEGNAAPGFKLEMATYELGKDWDIETIIKIARLPPLKPSNRTVLIGDLLTAPGKPATRLRREA